jgi:hypothetical protein
MTRLILTFENVFQVLAADKLLKGKFNCRAVPTPAGLSSSICSISLELLQPEHEEAATERLVSEKLKPLGVHKI